jgi:hypothetical protein
VFEGVVFFLQTTGLWRFIKMQKEEKGKSHQKQLLPVVENKAKIRYSLVLKLQQPCRN